MTASQGRQIFYGLAAVTGLVLTWYFNLRYAGPNYLADWFANEASSSAAVDLLVLAAVLTVFMIAEARRLQMRFVVVFIIAGFLLAMAFAVPAFLLYRERILARATRAEMGPH